MILTGYQSKYFKTEEYVDPATFSKIGRSAIGLIDVRILWTMDKIKEFFGNNTVIINNWLWKGNRKFCGYRPYNCNVGAAFSQHKFGRAVDFLITSMDATIIRKEILSNQNNEAFQYITAMEDFRDMDWVHIDVRNFDRTNGIFVFRA
jgi:hypothetical protein